MACWRWFWEAFFADGHVFRVIDHFLRVVHKRHEGLWGFKEIAKEFDKGLGDLVDLQTGNKYNYMEFALQEVVKRNG